VTAARRRRPNLDGVGDRSSPVRLAPFRLENWLAEHERTAECLLAHSGIAAASLADLGEGTLAIADLDYGEVPNERDVARAIAGLHGAREENVLVTVGASEADLAVALALAGPGDEVVVERPTYWPLEGVPRALGAKVVPVARPFEDAFRLDPDAVRRAITPRTRLVSLASPNNPTGIVVPPRDLVAIAEAASEVGAVVLVDEVFRDLARKPTPTAFGLHPSIVVAGSLTKCLGLGGLRTGWIVAEEPLRAAFREAKALTTISNSPLLQRLALKAIERRAPLLARARAIRDENWRRLEKWLDGQSFFDWVEPDGGVAFAPRLPAGVDDEAFARRLLAGERTLVAPGTYFGLPGHLRLGFGAPPERFAEGLARLARFVGRG